MESGKVDPACKPDHPRNLNRRLKAIIDSSYDGIWVCDGRGTITYINQAGENLTGVPAADAVGKNIAELVRQGFFNKSIMLEVLRTRKRVNMMVYSKLKQKHIFSTATPYFDDRGNIDLVVVNDRDMTELNAIKKELEQTREVSRKYREELVELNLMELTQQEIVFKSDQMRHVMKRALKLSYLDESDILLLGESGTGKGLLTRFIHKASNRRQKPFIHLNCASLPASLLEAELFGYDKGAFTGAKNQGKAGLIELARDGTLFLDEIGDMPLSFQAKILTFLDTHNIMRLGATRPKKVDCTIIAATNQDLEQMVKEKRFRQDLYYRLNIFTLAIPSLRQRPEDIFELAAFFLQKYNRKYNTRKQISSHAFECLLTYTFAGNVRELQAMIRRAVAMSEREFIDDALLAAIGMASQLPPSSRSGPELIPFDDQTGLTATMLATERRLLEKAMAHCDSTRKMAKYLKISQAGVVRRLKKHALKIKKSRSR